MLIVADVAITQFSPVVKCDVTYVWVVHVLRIFVGTTMDSLFLFAGLAVCIWGLVLLRWGGLLAMSLLTLFAGICLGSEFLSWGPLTIDRLLLLAICGAYVFMSKLQLTNPKPLSWADFLLFAFLVVLVISTFTHDWRWQDNMPLKRLIFYYVSPCILYWVGRQSLIREQTLHNIYWGVGVFGFYLAITAVFEMIERYDLVFPRYIASAEHVEFLGRGRGPLLNPSGNGILLCLGLHSCLMAWPRLQQAGRLGLVGAYLIFSAGIYATLTRCVWLGAALCSLIIVHETFSTSLKKAFACVALLGALVIVPLNWDRFVAFKRDKNVSVHDMKESAKLRPLLAYAAWSVCRDKPLTGLGLGHYVHYHNYYINDRTTQLVMGKARGFHQHNVFLSLLTETGLPGMALFAMLLGCWFIYAKRLWRADIPLAYRQHGLLFLMLLVAYLGNGMFQDVSIVPMVHMVLFFFAGLTVGQYQLLVLPSTVSSRRPLSFSVLSPSSA